jgi:polyisoprenyl-phosphate glycosyltransferase
MSNSLRVPAVQPPAKYRLRQPPRLVSIVVPVYNEDCNIRELAQAIASVFGDQAYELMFVNDGSSDRTPSVLEELAENDPRVVAVSLARNFGHQAALSAGLNCARGDVVITMDGDMQHPPALIPELILKWQQGANIVHTQRHDTAAVPVLKRLTSRLFYRLFSALCGVPIRPGMADFRLLDRIVVDEITHIRDGQPFFRAMCVWMGYQSAVVPFTVAPRFSGISKYTVRRMLRMAMGGVLSFSTVPLRMGLGLGLVMGCASLVELAVVLIAWLRGATVPGWASMVGVMSLFFSGLFAVVGIQGQYLIRLYERVTQRPPFIIESIIRQNTRAEARSRVEGIIWQDTRAEAERVESESS